MTRGSTRRNRGARAWMGASTPCLERRRRTMTETRRRITTVVLAPSAALATWALIRLLGVDLVVSTGSGKVGPAAVFAAAFVAVLAGWAAARVFERRSRRPRRWWSTTAS